jgi:hypothetical protein
LLDAIKAPLAPANRAEWQRDEAVARAQLNESACQQAREDGRRLSMEQAIDYALVESS